MVTDWRNELGQISGSVSDIETNDPDLPKLRRMLAIVQAAVANGEMSPRVGCVVMGQYADSLASRKRK